MTRGAGRNTGPNHDISVPSNDTTVVGIGGEREEEGGLRFRPNNETETGQNWIEGVGRGE